MITEHNNISAVISVYNKKDTIRQAVDSLLRQAAVFKEIYIIDDGSNDGSTEVIKEIAAGHENIIPIFQRYQGIAAALNKCLEKAQGGFVAVMDADVVLQEGWLDKLMPYFQDEKVAAVSGMTKLANDKNIWAMLGGYNVEYRQLKIRGQFVDHLSTCNTIYRRSALNEVGLFDIRFYYGQDNDLSYRMIKAGYKLVLLKDVFCLHYWPQTLRGFFMQRFNGAIGRIKLIQKHPGRWKGDKISNLEYFLELPLGAFLMFFLLLSLINRIFLIPAVVSILFLYALELNEISFFITKKKVAVGLLLPFLSLLKSAAWISGICYFLFGQYLKNPKQNSVNLT